MPGPAHPAASSLKPTFVDALIIGAGVTGLSMGCQLRMKLGVTDVAIIEREPGIGGTWWSNTYPGAGCDIPIPLYSFSFDQKNDWTTFFALQHEIQTYLQSVADKFDLTRKTHLNTEVSSAHWDEALGLWHVYTRPAKGLTGPGEEDKHWVCRVLVSGVGGLSQPNPCTIPGKEKFKGPLFHSARWDHSVSVKGKNVIVAGNGCSATQFVPIIAKEAKQVTQFVRSKHWYAKRPANPVDFKLWRWIVRYVPGFVYVQRAFIYAVLELSMLMMFRNFIGTWYRNKFAADCIAYIKKTAPPKYHDALVPGPELQPGCKRRVFDTDYLPTLRRSNVELERSALVEIKENSVITQDGQELPADVIIMANGFNITEMGFPMKFYGKSGKSMQDYWAQQGGPQVYRGAMMSDFPNLFLCMGPNTGTGHFSYIFTSECVTEMSSLIMAPILRAPRPTVFDAKAPGAKRSPSVVVKASAELEEQCWIQSTSQNMVYSYNCGSWYVDPNSGRVAAVYPSFQTMFMLRAKFPMYSKDLIYTGVKAPGNALSRVREFLGIGGIPKPTREQLRKFKAGDYVVGQPQIRVSEAKEIKKIQS